MSFEIRMRYKSLYVQSERKRNGNQVRSRADRGIYRKRKTITSQIIYSFFKNRKKYTN